MIYMQNHKIDLRFLDKASPNFWQNSVFCFTLFLKYTGIGLRNINFEQASITSQQKRRS